MKITAKQYRAAAKLIAEGRHEFACHALDEVCEVRLFGDYSKFESLFSHEEHNRYSAWLTNDDPETDVDEPLGREIRIMALLFMAYITECES